MRGRRPTDNLSTIERPVPFTSEFLRALCAGSASFGGTSLSQTKVFSIAVVASAFYALLRCGPMRFKQWSGKGRHRKAGPKLVHPPNQSSECALDVTSGYSRSFSHGSTIYSSTRSNRLMI